MDLIEFHKLKKTLSQKKELKLKVVSDSMYPLIKVGDLITVSLFDPLKFEKFDIVVFWQEDKLMSHYLWSKKQESKSGETFYITKSLKNQLDFDLPLKEGLLLGKVNVRISLMTKIKVLLTHFFK